MIYIRYIDISFAFLITLTLFQPLCAQKAADSSTTLTQFLTPRKLLEQDSIPVTKTVRSFRPAKYNGLYRRYQRIDGIVMVGVKNSKDEVLLRGPDKWSPPGGAVKRGEKWAAAAARIIKDQTGAEVFVQKPILLEHIKFQKKKSEGIYFKSYILHFEAKALDNDSVFVNNPTSGNPPGTFKWFHKMPKNAHPNHISHIQLFLKQDSE